MLHFRDLPQEDTSQEGASFSLQHEGGSLRFSPGSGLRLVVGRVAHGAELGHEEVVAAVVRRRVLLDVGKLHKLEEDREEEEEDMRECPLPHALRGGADKILRSSSIAQKS